LGYKQDELSKTKATSQALDEGIIKMIKLEVLLDAEGKCINY